jgi:hypothetical protein
MASLAISETLDFRGDVYIVFDGLARLAVVLDQVGLAARLAAIATSVRQESGIQLSAAEQARVDRVHSVLRALPDGASIDEAWSTRIDWTHAEITRLSKASLAPLLSEPNDNELPGASSCR